MAGILIQTLAFAMMGPARSVATDFQSGRDRPVPVAADRPLRVPARPLLRRDARGDPHRSRSCSAPDCSSAGARHSGFLEITEGGPAAARVLGRDHVDRHLARHLRAFAGRGDGHRLRDHVPAHVHLERVRADHVDAEGAAVVRERQPDQRADRGDPRAVRQPDDAGDAPHVADGPPGARGVALQHRAVGRSGTSSRSAATGSARSTERAATRPQRAGW